MPMRGKSSVRPEKPTSVPNVPAPPSPPGRPAQAERRRRVKGMVRQITGALIGDIDADAIIIAATAPAAQNESEG